MARRGLRGVVVIAVCRAGVLGAQTLGVSECPFAATFILVSGISSGSGLPGQRHEGYPFFFYCFTLFFLFFFFSFLLFVTLMGELRFGEAENFF